MPKQVNPYDFSPLIPYMGTTPLNYDWPDMDHTTEIQAIARYCTGGSWNPLIESWSSFQKAVSDTEKECFTRKFERIDWDEAPVSDGTSIGFPLEREYTDREEFLLSPDRYQRLIDFYECFGAPIPDCISKLQSNLIPVTARNGNCFLVWRCMPKGELLPPEKAVNSTTRLITYPDLRFTCMAGTFFHEQNNEMCTVINEFGSRVWNDKSHMASHFNRYTDFNALMCRISKFRRVVDIDWPRWDAHFRTPLQMECRDMRARNFIFKEGEKARFDWYYDSVTNRPVLDSRGQVWMIRDSEGSGTYNTYNDNTLGNLILVRTALIMTFGDDYESKCDFFCGGDDTLIALNDSEDLFIENILKVSEMSGNELVSDRIKVGYWWNSEFFSMKPILFDGMFMPATVRPDKILNSVVFQERWLPRNIRVQRLQSLLNETVWDIRCREILVPILVSYGQKNCLNEALRLYLDPDNFSRKCPIAFRK